MPRQVWLDGQEVTDNDMNIATSQQCQRFQNAAQLDGAYPAGSPPEPGQTFLLTGDISPTGQRALSQFQMLARTDSEYVSALNDPNLYIGWVVSSWGVAAPVQGQPNPTHRAGIAFSRFPNPDEFPIIVRLTSNQPWIIPNGVNLTVNESLLGQYGYDRSSAGRVIFPFIFSLSYRSDYPQNVNFDISGLTFNGVAQPASRWGTTSAPAFAAGPRISILVGHPNPPLTYSLRADPATRTSQGTIQHLRVTMNRASLATLSGTWSDNTGHPLNPVYVGRATRGVHYSLPAADQRRWEIKPGDTQTLFDVPMGPTPYADIVIPPGFTNPGAFGFLIAYFTLADISLTTEDTLSPTGQNPTIFGTYGDIP